MSLPIFQKTIVDSSGNIQPGASVAVRNETTGELVTIYADREGGTAKANPFLADSEGFATFYVEPGEYQVTATTTAGTITWSHVAIGDTALLQLAQPTGDTLVGSDDGASGSLWSTVAGFIARLRSSAGAALVGFIQAGAGAVQRAISDEIRDVGVTPLQFGAVGDGVANDTAACQLAADRAQVIGGALVFPAGYTFGIQGYVLIKNGVRAVIGRGGAIKFLNDVASSGVCLLGRESGEPANVSNCRVEGLLIDCNGKIGIPIYGQNINTCTIANNTILNVKNGPGILVRCFVNGMEDAYDNIISNNTITGDTSVSPTSYGISLDSPINVSPHESADTYWKATFTAADATYKCVNNTVTGNRVIGGYYGIALSAATYNTVTGNNLSFNVRNISVQNNSNGNTITGNVLQESVSSAVHLAYGSSLNQVSGNQVYTTRATGQGLIQAYVGAVGNKITGNHLVAVGGAAPRWHLYCGVHSSRNEFSSNTLRGNAAKAYIAVESAWDNTVTNAASYGFGESSAVNSFANSGMSQVVIKENTIDGQSAVSAVFISQISDAGGNYSLTQCVVRGNVLLNNTPSKQLELMEEVSGQLNQIALQDNTFHLLADATKFTLPRGRAHFSASIGNVFLNDGFVEFAANDTTPSVGIGGSFQHVDTAATSVTYYDEGADGQDILVRFSINTTIVHNNALIRLKGSVNAVGNSNNFIMLRRVADVWFEMWRNF